MTLVRAPGAVPEPNRTLVIRRGLISEAAASADAVELDAGVDVIAHVPDTTEGPAPLLREAAARGRWLVPTLDMFAQTVSTDRAYLDPIHASLDLFREEGGRLLSERTSDTCPTMIPAASSPHWPPAA